MNGSGLPPEPVGTPLTDFAPGEVHHGYPGGLYPGGNSIPPEHLAVQTPVALTGPLVVLALGMSSFRQEWCNPGRGPVGPQACKDISLVGQATADPEIDSRLVFVNGARAAHGVTKWDEPTDPVWANVDADLSLFGHGRQDVQVVFSKMVVTPPATPALPDPQANCLWEAIYTSRHLRTLKVIYPQVRQVYLVSRIYGGYSPSSGPHPEPFAYESGFAVKWVVEDQIRQLAGGSPYWGLGDLSLDVAPWVAWGPYLWADGTIPRADGLTWDRADFQNDGTHPSNVGEEKVAGILLSWLKTSTETTTWAVA